MTNETPISIRIPVGLLRRLDKEAAKQSRSRSNLIVLLIEQGLPNVRGRACFNFGESQQAGV